MMLSFLTVDYWHKALSSSTKGPLEVTVDRFWKLRQTRVTAVPNNSLCSISILSVTQTE